MNINKRRPVVGVMGGASEEVSPLQFKLARQIATALATNNCILLTGECRGLPNAVVKEAKPMGVLTVGVSPAESDYQIDTRLQPDVRSDLVIFTGFGLKGRNVVNIRSSDIVLIFGGSIGTLNEFTIAYDEGRIVGVLEGSGGVADQVRGLIQKLNKKTGAVLIFESDPEKLLRDCMVEYNNRYLTLK